MRISDWSSDVCSSDLLLEAVVVGVENLLRVLDVALHLGALLPGDREDPVEVVAHYSSLGRHRAHGAQLLQLRHRLFAGFLAQLGRRSEEHTSELQSLMRISYAVFCLQKKNSNKYQNKQITQQQ